MIFKDFHLEKLYLGECDIKKIDADAFEKSVNASSSRFKNNPISEDPESRKNFRTSAF
jgi:hypothetical protein